MLLCRYRPTSLACLTLCRRSSSTWEKRWIVGFDPAPDGNGYTPGDTLELNDPAGYLQDYSTVTLAFAPDGSLYGVNSEACTVLSFTLVTGAVSKVAGPDSRLTSAPEPGALELNNTDYLFVVTNTTAALTKVNLGTGTVTVSIEGDDAFVNDRNDKVYAISYVEFECIDQSPAE